MIDKGLDFTGLKYYTEKFKTYVDGILSAVAKSGSYNDLKDKPTIPSVGNGKITITQNGTTKGTFTTNQTGNTTIELSDNNTTYSTGTSDTSGLTKLYTSTGTNTDGTMTQASIKSALDGKSNTGHTHDDRYYTESEVDTKLNAKANSSHTHGNADITALDASKITSGTISVERLPKGALERCVIVADDSARFKLTTSSVQTGDTVKVTETGKMYFVIDDSKLTSEAGYEVYTAGSATSVPWSGVTDKPTIPSVGNGTITITQNGTTKGTFTTNQSGNTTIALTDTNTNTTYDVVSTTANGLAPKRDGSTTKFLRGDGTWAVPPDTNTTYSNFVKSGSGAKAGLVPAPSTTAGITKYLREDGTWTAPPNTITMEGATSSAAGSSGLVPAPASGKQTSFLRGDGTWVVPTNTTYSAATTSTAGLMSASDKSKLDGISTGANKTTVDSSLSSSSSNPVQNKVIYSALSGKMSSTYEIVSSTEPTNQSNGNYWCKDY